MESINFTLRFINRHMFVELNNELWLIDTGAPTTFGDSEWYYCRFRVVSFKQELQ